MISELPMRPFACFVCFATPCALVPYAWPRGECRNLTFCLDSRSHFSQSDRLLFHANDDVIDFDINLGNERSDFTITLKATASLRFVERIKSPGFNRLPRISFAL